MEYCNESGAAIDLAVSSTSEGSETSECDNKSSSASTSESEYHISSDEECDSLMMAPSGAPLADPSRRGRRTRSVRGANSVSEVEDPASEVFVEALLNSDDGLQSAIDVGKRPATFNALGHRLCPIPGCKSTSSTNSRMWQHISKSHRLPELKKQHELRGVSWKDCVCDGPHGQPEEEHDINEGRSVGSAKGTISCYLQDCPLMFRTHAAAYVHGQEEHGFLPVRVYEFPTDKDLARKIDRVLMVLSYKGVQLSAMSTKNTKRVPPVSKGKRTGQQKREKERKEEGAPKSSIAPRREPAEGSSRGDSGAPGPSGNHTIDSQVPAKNIRSLLGIEQDVTPTQKDLYFSCHRSGVPGASGGSSGGTHRRPVKEKSPPKRTTSAKRKGKVQGVGPKFKTKTVKRLGFQCSCRMVVKIRPGATTVTYYPQHNHGLDAVDEVCRRVPQALRQLILDYYVMGMRPKEILTHVGDLSWSDLQERDRLWLRLATTNAHQGAEPQASQLKAKAPLPSKSAGDASSDTEDQVPSTPGGNDAESQTDDPIQQLLGTNTHGDGLSHKDFNFQEVLTTSTICGICRSKLATPSSEVRYLGTNTIEEELMLAIKDPLRADSVLLQYLGRKSDKPKLKNSIPGTYMNIRSRESGPLREGTVFFVFQTPFQARMMMKHGPRAILCDATHGTTQLGYRLLSVFISIPYGARRTVGMAVGWAVASEETEYSWGLLFDCLKANIMQIQDTDRGKEGHTSPFVTEALVSDDSSPAWNAAQRVFRARKRYLCLWHVLQNFLRHSAPIRDKSVRKKIWRHLYELLHAEKEDNLDGLVKQFCDHWGKAEKCKTFVKYFRKHYATRKEQWMLAYRNSRDLSTNNIVESFHRKNLRIGRMIDRLFDYEASACRRVLLLEIETRRKYSLLECSRNKPKQFKIADLDPKEDDKSAAEDNDDMSVSSDSEFRSMMAQQQSSPGRTSPEETLEASTTGEYPSDSSEIEFQAEDSQGNSPSGHREGYDRECSESKSLQAPARRDTRLDRGKHRLVNRLNNIAEAIYDLPSHVYSILHPHVSAMEAAVGALRSSSVSIGTQAALQASDAESLAESQEISRILEEDEAKMKEDGNEFVLRRLLSQSEKDRRAEDHQLQKEAEEFVKTLIQPYKRQKV